MHYFVLQNINWNVLINSDTSLHLVPTKKKMFHVDTKWVFA